MSRLALAAIALAVVAVAVPAVDAVAHARALAVAGPGPDLAPLLAALDANGNEVAVARSRLAELGEGTGAGVVVAGRGRALAERESGAVAALVRSGGGALVLGDPDAAGALGVEVLPARVLGGRASLGETRVVLDPRPGARVLLATANESFADADGDGRAGPGDAAGPFLAGSVSGRVAVFGTPDLFAPATLADPEIADLVRDVLADVFPAGTRVVVDDSRGAAPPAALARGALAAPVDLARSPALAAASGLPAIAAGVLVALAGGGRGGEPARAHADEPVRRRAP